jgi:uncharacterized protein YjbK
MSPHREQELKLTIPHREHFLHLRDDPVWGRRGHPVVQSNHYFDSAAGGLRRCRILLRLREERQEGGEARHSLTLKVGAEVRPGYFESLETERSVAASWFHGALGDPGRILAAHPDALEAARRQLEGEPLLHVGTLVNERVERLVAGHRLEVDRLHLPDGREAYELEVETDDAAGAEAWLRESAGRHGIVLAPSRRTKMELLMDALRQ